jgi:hypothetical protein
MINILRLHLLDDTDDDQQYAHSLGIRTLRHSGGSVVVMIPPDVLDLTELNATDDVVIRAAEDSITLTKLANQDTE